MENTNRTIEVTRPWYTVVNDMAVAPPAMTDIAVVCAESARAEVGE